MQTAFIIILAAALAVMVIKMDFQKRDTLTEDNIKIEAGKPLPYKTRDVMRCCQLRMTSNNN